jgi:hypothetical protein
MWKPKSTGSGKGDKYTISSKTPTDPLFDWSFKTFRKSVLQAKYLPTSGNELISPIAPYTGKEFLGVRGIVGGAYGGAQNIDYFTTTTEGNAISFGNLTDTKACSASGVQR